MPLVQLASWNLYFLFSLDAGNLLRSRPAAFEDGKRFILYKKLVARNRAKRRHAMVQKDLSTKVVPVSGGLGT
jgi:hypothetical protein